MQTAITPGYQQHEAIQDEVVRYLENAGFYVVSQTYHDAMPKYVSRLLQYRYSPAALFVRSRADRMAIHKSRDVMFEFEAKSHFNDDFMNLTCEAMPFLDHVLKWRNNGIDCLYAFTVKGRGGGFWVSNHPAVRDVRIPSNTRYTPAAINMLERKVNTLLPGVKVLRPRSVNGSGDPFLVIGEREVMSAQTWVDAINSKGVAN